MWGVRSSGSNPEGPVYFPLLSLGLHSYAPSLGRESKWERILKILGRKKKKKKSSHPGQEADSCVVLQPIHPRGLK